MACSRPLHLCFAAFYLRLLPS
uniref:Uncharacterized protein n=1 Tax=Arundo donax TaxID=35708 RepID=A0A0A8ZTV0_ARUDO